MTSGTPPTLDYATPKPPIPLRRWLAPTAVWIALCCLWLFATTVLVPPFERIYMTQSVPLPDITIQMLLLSRWVRHEYNWLCFPAACAAMPYFMRQAVKYRHVSWILILLGHVALILSIWLLFGAITVPFIPIIS